MARMAKDRNVLWSHLESIGERKVQEQLAAGTFDSFDEPQILEWLNRKAMLGTASDAKFTKWVAIISAIAAVVAAIASVAGIFSGPNI